MAKDARIFVKLTTCFPENPKILPLSDAAFRCLVEAVCWSREHLTDGFLAKRLALARWSLETLQELCLNDVSKPSLIEMENGWFIRDFTEHQDTKADVHERRERAIAAGRMGGLAKAKHTAKRTAKRTASKPLSQTLSKNVAEEEEDQLNPNGFSGLGASACAPKGARTTANCARCDSDGRVELEPGITARCTHPEPEKAL